MDPDDIKRKQCEVEGCQRPLYTKTICAAHYIEQQKAPKLELPLRPPVKVQ